jgi:hypothetical protein
MEPRRTSLREEEEKAKFVGKKGENKQEKEKERKERL